VLDSVCVVYIGVWCVDIVVCFNTVVILCFYREEKRLANHGNQKRSKILQGNHWYLARKLLCSQWKVRTQVASVEPSQ